MARACFEIRNHLGDDMSFRTFLAMATLVILLPVHIVVGLLLLDDVRSYRHKLENDMRTITRIEAAAVDMNVRGWLSDLQGLALQVARDPTDLPWLRETLTAYLDHHPETSTLAIVDADGVVVAQVGEADMRGFAQHVIPQPIGAARRGTVFSSMLADPIDGKPLVGITTTVTNEFQVATTVVAMQRPDELSAFLADEERMPGSQTAIVDPDGEVVAASDRTLIGRPLTLQRQAVASDASIRRVLVDNVDMYVTEATTTVARWRVVLRAPAAALDEPTHAKLFGVLIVGGLLVLPVTACVLLGRYLGRRLEALTDVAREVSGDAMPQAMKPTGLREVDVVQQALLGATYAVREQAEVRERMADMKEALDRAQSMESVGQVMAAVAHDFGNLIFTINGNLELLRHHFDGQEREQCLIEPSLRLANEASRLISQLSAGARQKRRQAQLVNVNAELDEIGDLLRQVAGRSVTVDIQPSDDLLGCRLDPTLLRSALLNLVANARSAMPRGGQIQIRSYNLFLDAPAATTKGLAAGRYVTVSVTDNGIGIPSGVRARIFEPFFTTHENEGGSGFGLSILYGFVKAAGGYVGVDSVVGEGTTFTMCFPAVSDVTVDTSSLVACGASGSK
jgi:signal transduction histidine kinase